MLYFVSRRLISSAEKRLGVSLDYVYQIAKTKLSLLLRYNKLFGFLDPNRNLPAAVYHAARIRGAIASDCGTCVEAEINLARNAAVDREVIKALLTEEYSSLEPDVAAACRLADSVVGLRTDNEEAREALIRAHGDAGLIEVCFAMNGAALLPGVKRGMGYATACNIELMRGRL